MTFFWRLIPPTAAGTGTDSRAQTGAAGEASEHAAAAAVVDAADAAQATFATQGDAETHLGEHWRTWAAAGVTAVTLMSDATPVYRLSLPS